MKYGMRERVSGAVILLALGVIFIPMLFDDPPAREDRPEPVLTIEQPIDVEQTPVAEPERPASLGQIQSPQAPSQTAMPEQSTSEVSSDTDQPTPQPDSDAAEQVAAGQAADAPRPDPIAELAQRAGQGGQQAQQNESTADDGAQVNAPATAENGNWAVQVGSFGQPDNAARLEKQLNEQGFEAYSRPRENNLTTVYVGPFASSDDGEKARTALKEQANIQGLLIRVQEGE